MSPPTPQQVSSWNGRSEVVTFYLVRTVTRVCGILMLIARNSHGYHRDINVRTGNVEVNGTIFSRPTSFLQKSSGKG